MHSLISAVSVSRLKTNSMTDQANDSDIFSQRYLQKNGKMECHISHLRLEAYNKYTLCNLFAKHLPWKSIHLWSGRSRPMQCYHLMWKPKWQEAQGYKEGYWSPCSILVLFGFWRRLWANKLCYGNVQIIKGAVYALTRL